jgi:prolyl oligopeptidase
MSMMFYVRIRYALSYFMIAKKGLPLDGMTPTLLYGYGGFEISLGPRYATTVGISWLERGGVYVEANIRGGGEYGPQWHQSALKENRNKCYEDFIAVGEHLVATKVCNPKTLACRGGSNGGLLTGNMLVQAPDLFGAIHIAVPLLDMQRCVLVCVLRYPKLYCISSNLTIIIESTIVVQSGITSC